MVDLTTAPSHLLQVGPPPTHPPISRRPRELPMLSQVLWSKIPSATHALSGLQSSTTRQSCFAPWSCERPASDSARSGVARCAHRPLPPRLPLDPRWLRRYRSRICCSDRSKCLGGVVNERGCTAQSTLLVALSATLAATQAGGCHEVHRSGDAPRRCPRGGASGRWSRRLWRAAVRGTPTKAVAVSFDARAPSSDWRVRHESAIPALIATRQSRLCCTLRSGGPWSCVGWLCAWWGRRVSVLGLVTSAPRKIKRNEGKTGKKSSCRGISAITSELSQALPSQDHPPLAPPRGHRRGALPLR